MKKIVLGILFLIVMLGCSKNPAGPESQKLDCSEKFNAQFVISGYNPEYVVPEQLIEFSYDVNDNGGVRGVNGYSGGGNFVICKDLVIDFESKNDGHYNLKAKNISQDFYLKISLYKNGKIINSASTNKKEEITLDGFFK